MIKTLEDVRLRARAYAAERDWEQFHSPKNLAMALSVEAAELMEHFQWLREKRGGHQFPEQVLAMELAFSRREPYKWLGRYLHIMATTVSTTISVTSTPASVK